MQISFKIITVFLNLSHKKILSFLCAVFLLFPSISTAQQIPLHNQYVYNPLIINPAFAGVSAFSSFHLSTRSQWIGFSEGINTLSF